MVAHDTEDVPRLDEAADMPSDCTSPFSSSLSFSFPSRLALRIKPIASALLAAGLVGAEAAGADCSLTRLGITPLSDSAQSTYRGQPGGLYPGGTSQIPQPHLAAALAAARRVRPLDTSGRPAPNGQIVMVSIGMSNTRSAFHGFLGRSNADPGRNPRLIVVNGAQDTQTAEFWQEPTRPTWRVLDERIAAAGGAPAQVQVAWIKLTDPQPSENGAFPAHARVLQSRLEGVVRSLRVRFPNLQLAYLSSRTRAYTDAPGDLSPEPYAFETGFSVRWLIEKQMSGDASLNFDVASGPVVAPVLLWGPYLWADGTTPRSDGFEWHCNDLVHVDFVHPSNNGVRKIGNLLHAFFKSDPTAAPWYLRRPAVGSAPRCELTATPSTGLAPLTVRFQGRGTDADGTVIEYAYGFADGTGALVADPQKVFSAPSVYPVQLTVTDDDGNTGHCSTEIRVPEPDGAARSGVAPLVVGLAALARRRSPRQD